MHEAAHCVVEQRMATPAVSGAGNCLGRFVRLRHQVLLVLNSTSARRITNFMTMASVEILPGRVSKKFSFGTRVSSASFATKRASLQLQEQTETPAAA